MPANEFQPVIDWLRSPEGEAWSEDRLARARASDPGASSLTQYGGVEGVRLAGVFSMKSDGPVRGGWVECRRPAPVPGVL